MVFLTLSLSTPSHGCLFDKNLPAAPLVMMRTTERNCLQGISTSPYSSSQGPSAPRPTKKTKKHFLCPLVWRLAMQFWVCSLSSPRKNKPAGKYRHHHTPVRHTNAKEIKVVAEAARSTITGPGFWICHHRKRLFDDERSRASACSGHQATIPL